MLKNIFQNAISKTALGSSLSSLLLYAQMTSVSAQEITSLAIISDEEVTLTASSKKTGTYLVESSGDLDKWNPAGIIVFMPEDMDQVNLTLPREGLSKQFYRLEGPLEDSDDFIVGYTVNETSNHISRIRYKDKFEINTFGTKIPLNITSVSLNFKGSEPQIIQIPAQASALSIRAKASEAPLPANIPTGKVKVIELPDGSSCSPEVSINLNLINPPEGISDVIKVPTYLEAYDSSTKDAIFSYSFADSIQETDLETAKTRIAAEYAKVHLQCVLQNVPSIAYSVVVTKNPAAVASDLGGVLTCIVTNELDINTAEILDEHTFSVPFTIESIQADKDFKRLNFSSEIEVVPNDFYVDRIFPDLTIDMSDIVMFKGDFSFFLAKHRFLWGDTIYSNQRISGAWEFITTERALGSSAIWGGVLPGVGTNWPPRGALGEIYEAKTSKSSASDAVITTTGGEFAVITNGYSGFGSDYVNLSFDFEGATINLGYSEAGHLSDAWVTKKNPDFKRQQSSPGRTGAFTRQDLTP